MRATIKLSIIGLLLVTATLVFANRILTGSDANGQTGSLTAPAEVTASDNSYVTKIGINWDTVRGWWEGAPSGGALDIVMKDLRSLLADAGERYQALPMAALAFNLLREVDW